MYELYLAYLDSMSAYYDEFSHYAHAGSFGSGGAWGAKESIGQDIADAHKYRALVAWLGLPVPQLVDFFPPSIPAGLAAASVLATQVVLTWEASTDASGVDGYQVYQNGSYIGYTSQTTYTVTGLNPQSDYAYSLKAVDVYGNISRMSDTLTATTVSLAAEAAAARTARRVLSVQALAAGGSLIVHNAAGAARIDVYSMAGRRLASIRNVQTDYLTLPRALIGSGVRLLTVSGTDGVTRTLKVSVP